MELTKDEVFKLIDEEAPRFGVSSQLARAIALAENTGSPEGVSKLTKFRTDLTSPAKAYGIMQVLPSTFVELKRQGYLPADASMSDARGQIRAGLAAIKEMQTRATGADQLAAHYNGGIHGLNSVKSNNYAGLAPETQLYLKKVRTALGGAMPNEFNQNTQTVSGSVSSSQTRSGTPSTYLQNAISSLEDMGIQIEGFLGDLNSTNVSRQEATDQQLKAIELQGKLAGKRAQNQAELAGLKEAQQEKILSSYGINIGEMDQAVVAALDTINRTDSRLQELGGEVAKRRSVGLFDNPLEYIINQLQLPGMIGELDSLKELQKQTIGDLQDRQRMAVTQLSADQALTADKLTQDAVDAADYNAAKANEEAAKLRSETASAQARDALTLINLADKDVDNKLKAAQLAESMESKRESQSVKLEQKAQEEDLNRRIKFLGQLVGREMDLASVKGYNQKARNLVLDRADKGALGNDLYESMEFLQMADLGQMAKSNLPMVNMIKNVSRLGQQEASRLEKLYQASGTKKKADELAKEAFDNVQKELEAESKGDGNKLPPSSPYRIPYSFLARSTPELKSNYVSIVVRQLQDVTGDQEGLKINDEQVLGVVVNGIKQKKLTVPQAAEAIAQFYAKGTEVNNSNRGFNLVGLPVQSDYRSATSLSDGKLIRLTDKAALEKFLTHKVIVQMKPLGDDPVNEAFSIFLDRGL